MKNANMLKQLQQMQARMQQIQEELESATVTGTAGGGALKVTCNGQQQITGVEITPDVLGEDPEMLADLFMAAANDALTQAREKASSEMGQLTAGLPIPPGMLP